MTKRLLITFLLIICCNSNSVIAQEKSEIFCQAIDKESTLPIVFATVRVKNKNIGVIADEDGFFRMPYQYKEAGDTIFISSIGYKTKEVAVRGLIETKTNIIKLQPKVEILGEVTLIGEKKGTTSSFVPARELVKKAIQKIPVNYPILPFSYVGYYRDYQILDKKYVNLNEGIVQVYDAGFHTDKLGHGRNQTALFKYNKNTRFPQDSALAGAYDNNKNKFIKDGTISALGGNELSILDIHDAIRNNDKNSFSFIYVFKENFLNNHEFRLIKTSYLDDIPIYEIAFHAKKEVVGVRHSAKGSIYISKDTFAVHKLLYYGYKVGESEPFYSCNIEYVPKGKYMYLNYISFNNFFLAQSGKDFKIEDVSFDKSQNAFYITFNNQLNQTAVNNKKNYKFILKNRKLSINKIEIVEPKVLKVSLVSGTISNIEKLSGKDMASFTYKIKNITDVANRKLNKITTVKANQFRELFVQEVFPYKSLPKKMRFVQKNRPLSMSVVNELEDKSKYWVNSPLKTTKQ